MTGIGLGYTDKGVKMAKSKHKRMKSDDAIARKIGILIREGYPQKQAAAIAYDMKRRGKIR